MANDVEFNFDQITRELYQFSYLFLPDDLHASQMVIDVFTVFFQQGVEEQIDFSQNDIVHWKKGQRIQLLKRLFILGKKRAQHFHSGQIPIPQSVQLGIQIYFYKLPLLERVALFLRHRLNLEINEMADICQLTNIEVINKLNLSRQHILSAGNLESSNGVFPTTEKSSEELHARSDSMKK